MKLHGQYFAHSSKSFFDAGVYRGNCIVTNYFMMSSPNAYLNASLIYFMNWVFYSLKHSKTST